MKTSLLDTMQSKFRFFPAALLACATALSTYAQTFNSGSDGSYGDLIITNNTSLAMPIDGIFKCKKISIAKGVHIGFLRNAGNTAVYFLATDDVSIDGYIHIEGGRGGATGGLAGPGGFDGGHPGFGSVPPGAGLGPGGGRGGLNDNNTVNVAGSGGYLYKSGWGPSTNHGKPYGTPVLLPLVGGSGGGGTIITDGSVGQGGGGGGGAILIASNTKIIFGADGNDGEILAYGGGRNGGPNGGSGGAVRIVAPAIIGTVRAYVNGESDVASAGRVRVDTVDASQMGLDIRPGASGSRGSFVLTGLGGTSPVLNILQVASQNIPEGQVSPYSLLLANGTSPNQTVVVQAKNFGSIVPINVVLTPESGDPIIFPANIDNTTKNPASATINLTIPINVPVTLHAWTR